MIVKEIEAKSILSKSQVYDYTLNAYVGYRHGCTYCYAKFMKRFTGHTEPWGDFVDVKIKRVNRVKSHLLQCSSAIDVLQI